MARRPDSAQIGGAPVSRVAAAVDPRPEQASPGRTGVFPGRRLFWFGREWPWGRGLVVTVRLACGPVGPLATVFLREGKIKEAIAQIERAVVINPVDAAAQGNLGLALLRKGRFDEAIVQFQEALQLAPGDPDVQDNLAIARRLARLAR